MSNFFDDECIQLSDEEDLAGAWMDIQDVGKTLHVDITGHTYMNMDNYATSSFEAIRLSIDDAIALREFLDVAIERMKDSVE